MRADLLFFIIAGLIGYAAAVLGIAAILADLFRERSLDE